MKTINKNLILNRGLLFSFAITALVWGYINIVLTGTITGPSHTSSATLPNTNLQFFMYVTIWSNIFCFIWSVLGLISVIRENEKLENLINRWEFKAAPVMWISITFVVLNFVLIPHCFFSKGFIWTIKFYFGISIFQHVLVPIFMVNDFRLTKGFNKKSRYSLKEIISNSLISLIPGIIWITLSIILLWQGQISPQYFFMKFFGQTNKTIIINSITVISILLLFLVGNIGLFLYHNKKYNIKE